MINVLNRYNGRKLKDELHEQIQDELRELDEHYLYELRISSGIAAYIYFKKDDFAIDGVKSVKTTPNGQFRIMNVMSDAAVKKLDSRINYYCEPEEG